MGIGHTIDRSSRSADAGRRERLESPDVVQAGRAVRYGSGQQRWAKTKQSATATDHITCDLLDSSGDIVEEIEVYCTLMNTTALNAGAPRFVKDKIIPVDYFMGQWRLVGVIDGDIDDCTC